ncbi:MAG: IS110 family transposase [Acidobacteriia bacterium]|nr:IS110 family transposase [Terriglobia bacterium]
MHPAIVGDVLAPRRDPADFADSLEQFPSVQHLASWAGLCPGNNESAGKRRAQRPGRGVSGCAARSVKQLGQRPVPKPLTSRLATGGWRPGEERNVRSSLSPITSCSSPTTCSKPIAPAKTSAPTISTDSTPKG